jgi:hypothetical protein
VGTFASPRWVPQKAHHGRSNEFLKALALSPEQVEKERQNNTDDYACGDGKIKSDVVFFDEDVTR